MSYGRQKLLRHTCTIMAPIVVGGGTPETVASGVPCSSLKKAGADKWPLEVTVKHHELMMATEAELKKGQRLSFTFPPALYQIESIEKFDNPYEGLPFYKVLLVETS